MLVYFSFYCISEYSTNLMTSKYYYIVSLSLAVHLRPARAARLCRDVHALGVITRRGTPPLVALRCPNPSRSLGGLPHSRPLPSYGRRLLRLSKRLLHNGHGVVR